MATNLPTAIDTAMNGATRILGMLLHTTTTLLVIAPSAVAGYLQAYTGNARIASADGATVQMTLNFAVLDRLSEDGAPGDVFGTGFSSFDSLAQPGDGSAPLDVTSRYLYLYQATNNGTITTPIGNLFVAQNEGTSLTSFAQWNLLLADDRGIVSAGNSFGQDNLPFEPDAPANVGVALPDVLSAAGTPLASGTLSLQNNGSVLRLLMSTGIEFHRTSVIFGATSNYPPQFLDSLDGLCGSNSGCGFIPKPGVVPEPNGLLMIVVAAFCVSTRSLCTSFARN